MGGAVLCGSARLSGIGGCECHTRADAETGDTIGALVKAGRRFGRQWVEIKYGKKSREIGFSKKIDKIKKRGNLGLWLGCLTCLDDSTNQRDHMGLVWICRLLDADKITQ